MKLKKILFIFAVVSSVMFSSCLGLPIVGGVAYGYGTRHSGEGRPISTESTNPEATNPGGSTNTGAATSTINTSDTAVVMEAWSNEYHYLFYKNGTVSIMDFNDKELSRPKYTSSSNTITINGEKYRFEDQSDNFESVPHKIGTLVKI